MFHKIMLALDLEHPDSSRKTVEIALHLAASEKEPVIFQILTVIPPLGQGFVSSFLPKNYDEQMKEKAMEALHEFTAANFPTGSQIKHIVAHGTIYEEINRLAKEQKSDIILVTAGKPTIGGLGPNAARVSRYSEKPVLIIR